MSQEKFLLYPAEGDTDEDQGMTKKELMEMLAEELGYKVAKKNAAFGITAHHHRKLLAAQRRLIGAEVADSWKGGGDPIDVPEIELELLKARNAWVKLVDQVMEKP